MARASNYPAGQLAKLQEENPDFVKNTMNALRKICPRQKKIKTNEELVERIEEYFKNCGDSGLRPGIESLSLALGISRVTVYEWSNGHGCDKERQEIVNRALQLVGAFLETAGVCGKIAPVTYIFLCKNWLGYTDSYSVSANAPDAHFSAAEIEERLKNIEEAKNEGFNQ